jgi:hypothetical protein
LAVLCGAWLTPVLSAQALADLRVYASAHYHVHTNLEREAAVPFGRHMDAVYERFAQRFASYQPEPAAGRMPLYLFRTRGQYRAFLEAHGIAAEGSGGMFFITHRLQGLATWVEGRDRRQTFGTLQHEGFHQFAWHHLGRNLPTWVNEGLAQYFEDAVLLERGMHLGLADPPRMALVRDALTYGYALDTAELMRTTHRDWSHSLTHQASRSELLYAQAWSLVYYLIHGDDGRYLRSFEVYLRLISDGEDADDSFRAAFGYGALTALDRRWRAFAVQQQPDEVARATQRMTFLGAALAYKHERSEIMPRTLAGLRRDLQARGFTLTRQHHGLTQKLRADDQTLFAYTLPGGRTRQFLLLEPSAHGLPPRLTAPGLEPEPTLTWHRDDGGAVTPEIIFR